MLEITRPDAPVGARNACFTPNTSMLPMTCPSDTDSPTVAVEVKIPTVGEVSSVSASRRALPSTYASVTRGPRL